MSVDQAPLFEYYKEPEIRLRLTKAIRGFRMVIGLTAFIYFSFITITAVAFLEFGAKDYQTLPAVTLFAVLAAFASGLIIWDHQKSASIVNLIDLAIRKRKFWILWTSEILVHPLIEDLAALDNIPQQDIIFLSRRVHIVKNSTTAVALRLVT